MIALDQLEVPLRLLVAIVVGGCLGWERERRSRPAGLRTHMMVALGSASFALVAMEMFRALADERGFSGDPLRLVQGIVGGIGFLCAGTIIRDRTSVKGVTTAASLWVSGAVGIACGVGAYLIAISTALLSLVVLSAVGWIERRFLASPSDSNVSDEPK